ncbi:MAG: 50S ribosomal protein L35 [Candidatus Nomurabacteria bacterium]|jgi:large subunit ribosomal protein L35|nr:50S ribosomal protein L35 [Candidatus Nomurabacteria bacterium]
MPKLKSHSGTKKRVRITKTGKILRGNAGTRHFKRNQTKRSERAKATDSQIKGGMKKSIKRALGV